MCKYGIAPAFKTSFVHVRSDELYEPLVNNSKTAGCRAKWVENWDSCLLVYRMIKTFGVVVFKVIWESFGELVLKSTVTG